jgi:hypothetical protein
MAAASRGRCAGLNSQRPTPNAQLSTASGERKPWLESPWALGVERWALGVEPAAGASRCGDPSRKGFASFRLPPGIRTQLGGRGIAGGMGGRCAGLNAQRSDAGLAVTPNAQLSTASGERKLWLGNTWALGVGSWALGVKPAAGASRCGDPSRKGFASFRPPPFRRPPGIRTNWHRFQVAGSAPSDTAYAIKS